MATAESWWVVTSPDAEFKIRGRKDVIARHLPQAPYYILTLSNEMDPTTFQWLWSYLNWNEDWKSLPLPNLRLLEAYMGDLGIEGQYPRILALVIRAVSDRIYYQKDAPSLLSWVDKYNPTSAIIATLGPPLLSADNFDRFMLVYIANVRKISKRSMVEIGGVKPGSEDLEDETILEAKICWQVTNNIEYLLKYETTRKEIKYPKIGEELANDRLLIVHQDTLKEGHDHWFAVIGDRGRAHIVEYLTDQCPGIMTDSTENIVAHLEGVRTGEIPDRFYKEETEHKYEIVSYERRSLTEKTIKDRLKEL